MELLSVLNYLHNVKQHYQSTKTSSIFSISNKIIIKNQVKAIIERLKRVDSENSEDIQITYNELLQNDSRITEHKEKLQEETEKKHANCRIGNTKANRFINKIKIIFFESGGLCSHHLELA